MRLFNPYLYEKIHLLCVFFLTLIYYIRINRSYLSSYKLLARPQRHHLLLFSYVVAFIIVVGLRPVSFVFGDTVNYARIYEGMYGAPITVVGSEDSLFYLIMYYCAQSLDVRWFFLIIEFLYIIPIVLSCYRFLTNNYDIGILMCFAALSFYSYSVNGIRNGAACSIVMLAMSFLIGEKIEYKLEKFKELKDKKNPKSNYFIYFSYCYSNFFWEFDDLSNELANFSFYNQENFNFFELLNYIKELKYEECLEYNKKMFDLEITDSNSSIVIIK